MRIGINTLFHVPGDIGGSETYLLELLRALAAGPAAGDDLVLFTHRGNDAVLRAWLAAFPRLRYECLGFDAARRPVRLLAEQTALPVRVRRVRPDVLWSPGCSAPLAAPGPQVVTLYDFQYRHYPQDFAWPVRQATALLAQAAARRADRVLGISEFARGEILRFTGARPERVTATPLAADPAFAIPPAAATREAVRRRLGFDGPFWLCVAHTYPHKNVAALVRAFAALAPEAPHRLVLVGRPRRGEPAVQAALRGLVDPTRVARLSGLPREELIALYHEAGAVVHPSLYEGFGLPVLEAMMAGRPVLAARRASVPEVGGDAIRYFDPDAAHGLADALRELARLDPAARRTEGERAAARARTFTWARTAELTHAALRDAARTS